MAGSLRSGFHEKSIIKKGGKFFLVYQDTQFSYTFEHFFHPFLGELIQKLNMKSLPGLMDASWQETLETPDPEDDDPAHDFFHNLYHPQNGDLVLVESFPKKIDTSPNGSYSIYNWELFFHIPLTIAVHLSKNQRFAEAQRWFHFIFNPTSNDLTFDQPDRAWKFIGFREGPDHLTIDEIVSILSQPIEGVTSDIQKALDGFNAILAKPFQPHAVARTRHIAYQYSVVMKYLDNLISWGDHMFQQDTLESINEATQLYVLAANILGARPQRVPAAGSVRPKTFAQLRDDGRLGPIGNGLVELEGKIPFNLGGSLPNADARESSALFSIGQTLYFCLPRNDKLLGYWDLVADRLFKIRHCMNIAGVFRPLALFDPPIDPGMLVKAEAAGIDISSVVSGLNQPIGPVRSLALIQKTLELCGEVRGLGAALLAALEKGDAERLALTRQRHEIQIQQMAQEVRFLQWKSAQEATTSLLTSRATTMERLRYYQRLLGLPADQNAPETIALDRRELTEENFDEAFVALVGQYDKTLTLQSIPARVRTGGGSPTQQSGASGAGRLYLSRNEDAELNQLMPSSSSLRSTASDLSSLASVLTFIPEFDAKLAFWGLGAGSKIFGGSKLSDALKIAADIISNESGKLQDQATAAAKTASYERRADEWLLQYNLAARELTQNGRQILAALIAEQIAQHEYRNIQQQITNAQEMDQLLHDKFTNEDLYLWMQGEISRLYYEYYRFAFDTARKAERTMKLELMRPELDAQDFVKFNYWDGGRKGLLSGESLYLDVKRMEMAYHENNKRELELTKHISLRQLNPLALLQLKATGTCEVTLPEWLFDMDGPGHYMRRIKHVSLSIPSVTGPYTSVNCTLTLLRSTVRKSPLSEDAEDYAKRPGEDNRFVDYTGAVQSVVTSSGREDSGMFETNLRDERFLPFEGAGAESTWRLELPAQLRQFDYNTISDIILHMRYTARLGGKQLRDNAIGHLKGLIMDANTSGLVLMFSLTHEFPNEWHKFVTDSSADFSAVVKREYFPYFTQGRPTISINAINLYAIGPEDLVSIPLTDIPLPALNEGLRVAGSFELSIPESVGLPRERQAAAFILIQYFLESI